MVLTPVNAALHLSEHLLLMITDYVVASLCTLLLLNWRDGYFLRIKTGHGDVGDVQRYVAFPAPDSSGRMESVHPPWKINPRQQVICWQCQSENSCRRNVLWANQIENA